MKGWIANKYRIMDELGKGNNTNVYLCRVRDEEFFDTAAVKVYKINNQDEAVENYFKRECDALSMLRHKNIVNILDQGYDKENQVYYIALEYVEGKTLDEIIKARSLEKYNKEVIVNQVFEAIEYAHSQNILHRDLKPSNIMVTDDSQVKIIDFGISKILNSIATDGDNYTVQALTYKYASPEQKLGKTLTFQSDIYSLGIVLYEILEGVRFDLNKDNKKQIARAKKISSSKKVILNKMLEDAIENRFTNIYKVKREWKKLEANNQKKYSLNLSNNAINKLHELRMIDSSRKEIASSLIINDLKDEVYFASVKNAYNDENSDKYILWGRQIEYNCAIDKFNNDSFTIISINVPETYVIEKRKEMYGYPIDGAFDIEVKSENKININKLINNYGESLIKKVNIDKELEKTDEIIKKWTTILDIQKELISNNKNTLRYANLIYEEDTKRILLEIKDKIDEVEFTQDQVLVLTMKNSGKSFKTKRVGYFNDFKKSILSIDILRGISIEDFSNSGEVSVDTAFIDNVINKQEIALKRVKKSECLNRNLSKILSNPSIAKSTYLEKDIIFNNKKIDESKMKIIEDALSAKDVYLLQGPPGTGKTTFISELVYQQLKINPKAKILITSQSNVAVNHAMTKIKSENEDVKVVRLGRQEMINNGMEEYTLDAQLEELIRNIKNKSDNYFSKIMKRNFDVELMGKYKLTEELLDINKKIKSLNNELELDIKYLRGREERYKKTVDHSKQIEKIKLKFQNISKSVLEEDRNLVDNFMNEYINLGEQFITRFNNIIIIKEELNRAKEIIDDKARHLENYNSDIGEGYEELGVKSIEGVKEYQDIIEKKVASQKSKFKKYSAFEKLKNEWINKINNTDELGRVFLEDVSVVGATCIGIANYSYNFDLKFDLVIVDEAGRATPPELLVPMVLGKKIILVGDHKQLPPVIDKVLCDEVRIKSDYKRSELEESLFAYLQLKLSDSCKGILREQYRMHPVIGDLISQSFYGDSIISMVNDVDRRHEFERFNNKNIVWLDTAKNIEKYEETIGTTKQNALEARKIVDLLVELEENYKKIGKKKEVAVITGYKAQKNYINRLLERKNLQSFENIILEIDTVDAFQGRETDIVIYSIVRSNKEGDIGFLSDIRRLNVSLSRARELLVLIGDSNCVKINSRNPFNLVYNYISKNDCCTIEEV